MTTPDAATSGTDDLARRPHRRAGQIGGVGRDFVLIAGGQVAGAAIGFVVLALVARRIGPVNLGAYQVGLAISSYFQIPSNFGLVTLAIRDINRSPDDTPRVVAEAVVLQATIGLLMYALLMLARPLVGADFRVSALLPLVGLTVVISAVNFEWILQSQRRMAAVAWTRLLGQVVYGAAMPLFLAGGLEGARRYALINIAGLACDVLAVTIVIRRTLVAARFRLSVAALWRRFTRALPLGWTVVLLIIYTSTDAIMLQYLRGSSVVGQFSVAARLPQAMLALVTGWTTALFPYLAALGRKEATRIRQDIAKIVVTSTAFTLPATMGAFALGGPIMKALFGDQFSAAGLPFGILTSTTAIIVLNATFSVVLIALGDERRNAIAIALGVVLNASLDVALILPFGPSGAASATLLTELALLAYYGHRITALIGRPTVPWSGLARVAAASSFMLVGLLLLGDSLPALMTVGIGVMLYVVASAAVWRTMSLRSLLSQNREA